MSYESEIRASMNAQHERRQSDSNVRSLSCPPSAHVSQEEKYVLNPQYDIRCHESYREYYQSADTEKKMHLPPPLDMNPEIVHIIHARQGSSASQCPETPTFDSGFKYLTPLSTFQTSPLTKSVTPETELSHLNQQNSSDGTDPKNSSREEYDIITPSPRSEEYIVQRAEKCVPSPPAEEYNLMTPSPRSEEYSIKACAKYSLQPFVAEKYKGMKNPHGEESAVKTALEDEKYGGSILFSELTKKANLKLETSEMNDTTYLNLSGDETTMGTLEQSLEYSFSPLSIMSDMSAAPSYPHLLWSDDAEDYHEEPCPQDAGYAIDSSGHDCVKNTTESSQFHARRLYTYSATSLPHIKWNVNGRMLYKIVAAASPEDLLQMANVRKEFPDLMMDAVGHFLCQSIIGVSSGVYLTRIVDAITQSSSAFSNICFNWHGTHSMQTLLEAVSSRGSRKDMKKLCRGLFPLVSPLVMNAHGNHIIQKCLTLYVADPSQISYGFSFVFDVMADNMLELGRDRFGCVILQRCMQIGTQKQKDNLAEKACENCVELMQDPFGNYVVQYLLYPKKLDAGERPQRAEKLSRFAVERANYVSERIKGKVVEMANQKYSSNAVELCVECSDAKHRKSLVKEMFANAETLTELLQNDYGNYVIQKALDVSRGDELQKLLKYFHPIIDGQHFEGQVQRLCMKLFRKYGYHLQKTADSVPLSIAYTEENTTDVKESPNKMGSIYQRKNPHRTWNAVIKGQNINDLINVA